MEDRRFFSISPIVAQSVGVSATEGQQIQSAVVAKISQGITLGILNTFTATCDWGDGSGPQAAQIVSDAQGGFDVLCSHTYAHAGDNTVTVSVENILTLDSAQVTGDATVHNAALDCTTTSLNLVAGQRLNNADLLNFTDANASAVAADFTATINWGGGTFSTGTVVQELDGSFEVLGSRTCKRPGVAPISVTVDGAGGGSVAGVSTCTVADAATTLDARQIHLHRNRSSTQAVALFSCANPWSIAADFSAEIYLGRHNHKGALARVVSMGNGQFAVAGTFKLPTKGSIPLKVAVFGKGGAVVSVFSLLMIA